VKAEPIIQRAAELRGHKLVLRDVTLDDAAFILGLRLDPKKGAFLSATDGDLQKQIAWTQCYLEGSGQAYFVICDLEMNRLGTVRLYNAIGYSFSWGSWIVKDGAPASVALESALIVYRYALDYLGFSGAHFEVDRNNTSVWTFHERFGAKRVRQSEVENFYEIGEAEIRASLVRYGKFLPRSIVVTRD